MAESTWPVPVTDLPQPTVLTQVAMRRGYLSPVIQELPRNKASQPGVEPFQLDCTKDGGDESPGSGQYPVTH
jgi:hypothetical protein